jgi:hypothetical protein
MHKDAGTNASSAATTTDEVAIAPPRDRPVPSRVPLDPIEWGVPASEDERKSHRFGGYSRAGEFVSSNAGTIREAADLYGIPEMVLANVLYQEKMHNDPTDWMQDQPGGGAVFNNPTIGPGQIRVEGQNGLPNGFIDLIDRGGVVLTEEQYKDFITATEEERKRFARSYLIDTETGIYATAATIAGNLNRLADKELIPKLEMYDDPGRMSLEQFVYGAALYSRSGRSFPIDEDEGPVTEADKHFNQAGPANYIDVKADSIASVLDRDLTAEKQLVNAFRYLDNTWKALYGEGTTPPETLGGYFTPLDRELVPVNPDRRDAEEAEGRQGPPMFDLAEDPGLNHGPPPLREPDVPSYVPPPEPPAPEPLGVEEQARRLVAEMGFHGRMADAIEARVVEWAYQDDRHHVDDIHSSPGFIYGEGRDSVGIIGESLIDTGMAGGDRDAARRTLSDMRAILARNGGDGEDLRMMYQAISEPGHPVGEIYRSRLAEVSRDMAFDRVRSDSVGDGVIDVNGEPVGLHATRRTGDVAHLTSRSNGAEFVVEIREGYGKDGVIYSGFGTNERWYPLPLDRFPPGGDVNVREAADYIIDAIDHRGIRNPEGIMIPREEWIDRRIEEQRINSAGNAVVMLHEDDPRRVVATAGEGVGVDIVRASGERVYVELRYAEIAGDDRRFLGFGTNDQWYSFPGRNADGSELAVVDAQGNYDMSAARDYIERQARAGNINEWAFVSESEWREILHQRGRGDLDPSPEKTRLDGLPHGAPSSLEPGDMTQAGGHGSAVPPGLAAARSISPVGVAVEVEPGTYFPAQSLDIVSGYIVLTERDGKEFGLAVTSAGVAMPDGSSKQFFGVGEGRDWRQLPLDRQYVHHDGIPDREAIRQAAEEMLRRGEIDLRELKELIPLYPSSAAPATGIGDSAMERSMPAPVATASSASLDSPRLPSLDDRDHPGHRLYADMLALLREYEGQRGIDSGDFGRNLAADLTVRSIEGGLREVRHVVFNADGTRAFAVDTPNIDAEWRRVAYSDVSAAGQTPIERSAERAQDALTAAQQKEVAHAAIESTRTVDDPVGRGRSVV